MNERIETVRTEDLRSDVREAIIEVCVAAHDNDGFRRMFIDYFHSARHFLAYREDEVVAHAVVTTRGVQPEGHPVLRTAYVDAVSTLPECQGQGYGSAVMRALGAGIDDYEIACLETQREGFYERLGWEVWRGPLGGRSDDGLVPTPDQTGVMVLRLSHTPELDLDAPMTIEVQLERIW